LPGLRTHADADDLAGSALEDDQVADADEVAGDGDGVGRNAHATTGLDEADLLSHTAANTTWAGHLVDDDVGAPVVVTVRIEGVEDAVGGALEAAADGVVVTVVVVVTHVSFVWLVELDVGFDSYFLGRATAFELNVVGGVGAAAVVALGNVELVLEDAVVGLTSVVLDVDGVSNAAAVDFDVNSSVFESGWTLVPRLQLVKHSKPMRKRLTFHE
jgi:hypothetical protein